ncbi:uncharacterized protein LOC135375272 [Ornithodoros turicata]|uniref:uncharacterized protein LOC135375272 n=1 Tax=Ornithodoros turicata TaxID=34597 RepID=UPI003139A5A7
MSVGSLRYQKVFENENGRFLLVLLVNSSDIKFENVQFTLSDGNNVWKANTSLEDICGLRGSSDENAKHVMKRIKNSQLDSVDKERPSLSLLPPGRPHQLSFVKSNYDSLAGERLNMMISIANSEEMKMSLEHEDTLPTLVHKKPKISKVQVKPKAGMSLHNPGSRKITKERGVDFD